MLIGNFHWHVMPCHVIPVWHLKQKPEILSEAKLSTESKSTENWMEINRICQCWKPFGIGVYNLKIIHHRMQRCIRNGMFNNGAKCGHVSKQCFKKKVTQIRTVLEVIWCIAYRNNINEIHLLEYDLVPSIRSTDCFTTRFYIQFTRHIDILVFNQSSTSLLTV